LSVNMLGADGGSVHERAFGRDTAFGQAALALKRSREPATG